MSQDQPEVPVPGIAVAEGLSWSWHLDFETLLTACRSQRRGTALSCRFQRGRAGRG